MSELSSQRTRVIAAINGGVYGADAVEALLLDGAQNIIYQEVSEPALDPERVVTEIARARSEASGQRHRTAPLRTPVSAQIALTGRRGSALGQEAPLWEAWARMANLELDTSGGIATFTLRTPDQGDGTVYQFHRNLENDLYRLIHSTGVKGNLTIRGETDQELMAAFEGVGQYQGVLSSAAAFFSALGSIALQKDGVTPVVARTTGLELIGNQDPILIKCITFDYDGVQFPVSSFEVATNWTMFEKNVATGCSGLEKVLLTRPGSGQRVNGSWDFTDGAAALDKYLERYEDDLEGTLTIVATSGDGGSGSDRVTVSMPRVQVGKATMGDDSGVMTHSVPFFANGDYSGLQADNELQIVVDTVP